MRCCGASNSRNTVVNAKKLTKYLQTTFEQTPLVWSLSLHGLQLLHGLKANSLDTMVTEPLTAVCSLSTQVAHWASFALLRKALRVDHDMRCCEASNSHNTMVDAEEVLKANSLETRATEPLTAICSVSTQVAHWASSVLLGPWQFAVGLLPSVASTMDVHCAQVCTRLRHLIASVSTREARRWTISGV